jgi:mannose-6-phosphate isomerase-like protein (cupin superfamily)
VAIEIIDCAEVAAREKKRTVVMNTRKLHAWVQYYPDPGDHDDMHCHNEDQTFFCIEGQCTMHFPDGGKAALDPGMAALITGGSFYMLENTGDGPMVLMGNRSGSQDNIKHINYDTRKDLRAEGEQNIPFHKSFDEDGKRKAE